MLVYKHADVSNEELATLEEVRQAFFGAGIIVKDTDGFYYKVISLDPITGRIHTHSSTYDTQIVSNPV